ncbi:cobalamin biosynthesis protein CbiD [Anaerosacchariphilus sp. NSJ-68]|uniref:Cobalt-precorrin-5B C(1)-methyltransferase n=2 Tax=Lachnospiraceae TaxID=186803 RepID=A0A923RLN2_9FIRM|nr:MULTISPECIES: cobalt-precorrin-5B (C(1))-methyltransferase CbiD [Lachnospiraceae]MBC5659437.1 cobalamin biosynthesis protein CbiD [Anaerosacchariphilus hominis]MBC5697103.1 cobalamin biosynthesis protein CbiD [Roseburia difficilis]
MLDQYVYKNNKKMRMGYTTGSCAAAASKAAAWMLLHGRILPEVELMTPKGIALHLEVLEPKFSDASASCAIRKDAGDDPDVTDGLRIYATVSRTAQPGVTLDGGEGVGRVTRAGLEQAVGDAAINKVPRQMIREGVEEVCRAAGYTGGLSVIISIPGGAELARKTFNPRLGIVGGISVLGTSGIVEPMSEEALIQTIRVDIKMQLAGGRKYLVLVPGNYGLDFLEDYEPEVLKRSVKYSNFLGEAIDAAVEFGAKGILLVGHIGKLVKLAGGIMNTHSRNADARMDILTAHAAVLGADQETAIRLMNCITTDEALDILKEKGLLEPVMRRLMERMEFYVDHRSGKSLERGILTFSLEQGVLGESSDVRRLISCVKEEMTA